MAETTAPSADRTQVTRQRWRQPLRWAGRLLSYGLTMAVAIVVGFTFYAVVLLPPLQPWHTEHLANEFSARQHADMDFAGYQRLEAALFGEMRDRQARWPQDDALYIGSRFNAAGAAQKLSAGAPYNRSYRLRLPQPRGQALLVHGLSDSPYSMKALAEALHARGFEVTVLRLPGHGTWPSMMTTMSADDWSAAVRLAARDVAARAKAKQTFYLGGYSTGGSLALQYTLDALADPTLRRPDRLLLMAPAVQLTPLAALSEFVDVISVLPIALLQKVRWQEVVAEYDPYKYNSFAVNASRQIQRVTKTLQRDLARAAKAGRMKDFPPVLTWQSVVDSTVGADGVVDDLYARLQGPQHRLVLFDVNREPALHSVLNPEQLARIDRVLGLKRGYTLDVVGQADAKGDHVQRRRVAPDGAQQLLDSGLSWPENLVSLGHLALPNRPDDPVYGYLPGSGHDGLSSIGSWLLRGESGATTISLGALTRLRSNPFWALIEADVDTVVAEDLRGTTN